MRQIGTLPNDGQAQTFEDYILTRGMSVRVDEEDGRWAVWILDEDHVEQAKEELARFAANPDAPHYRDAAQQARQIRRQTEKESKRAKKLVVNVRNRWDRPVSQSCPLTILLILVSVFVTIATNFGRDRESFINKVWIDAHPDTPGLTSITRDREVWRLITPIFLHLNWMHLIFNALVTYVLGAMLEFLRGTGRLLLLVLLVAMTSNVAQWYVGGPYFGGMSGVGYGLFGYAWVKSRYEPESGIFLSPNTVLYMMAWFVLCFTGLLGSIANTAHAVGLGVGVAVAYAPIAWREMRRKP